jgi:tRNA (mo5U34)-methyltransferase
MIFSHPDPQLTYGEILGPQFKRESLISILEERRLWLERSLYQPIRELGSFFQERPSPLPLNFSPDVITIGKENDLDPEHRKHLLLLLKQLIPWRKGPFSIAGINLEAEWRAEKKWYRLLPYIDSLEDKCVLDIGTNNGYYMFRMLSQKPKLVLGIDPQPLWHFQFQALQHFCQIPSLHHELFEADHLPLFGKTFDTIFYMGISYHHRHPIGHLERIRDCLKKNGQLILETMCIPGDEPLCLFPEDRYAGMKNVWFIPTISALTNWLKKTHFYDIKIFDISRTDHDEQRSTDWCPPPRHTLKDFLHPTNPLLTKEGHPSPLRVCLSARAKN